MKGWERLTRRGEPARCRVDSGNTHPAIADLVALHGLGWIAGFFEVVEPNGETWNEWQGSARLLRSRGYLAGIDTAHFDALVVFARDAFGNALATARGADSVEHFYLLTCAGCVLALGTSVDDLLDALPNRASLLFPLAEQVWNASRGEWVAKHDWGIELTFVSPSFDGPAAYLRAVHAGEDADGLLETALAGEPFALAVHSLLAALCGVAGDAIPPAARADAVETLATVTRRRFGTLPGVPEELFGSEPWGSATVRAWAEGARRVAMRPGPFAEEHAQIEAMPLLEPIPDDARPPLEAPLMDYESLLSRWLVAWDALPHSPPLRRVRELAATCPPSLRFAVMRRLAWDRWSEEARTYPLSEGCRQLVESAVRLNQVDLGGPHLEAAWPLVLVYLVHATRFGYQTSSAALAALAGIRSDDLSGALVALAEHGLEWPVTDARLVNGTSIDDATLDRLLPTLKKKGVHERIVALVMGRMDDDRVYAFALASLMKWPRIIAPLLVARPGARTEAALRANLQARKLDVREAIAKALADLGDARAAEIYEETARRIDASI